MALQDLLRDKAVALSRNLFPSIFEKPDVLADSSTIAATIDIDEPLFIQVGETKTVQFRYRSGVPSSTAFGITWYATEEDADLLQNALQDEPLPGFTIDPPYPRADTGAQQRGTVTLVAPSNMRGGFIYGSMAIYQQE